MKQEFKVYSPLTRKSVDHFITKNKDGGDVGGERILLEGIASTTNRDLHDEIVALDAIESMANQASALNIHGDHFYNLEDTIGAIKEATVEGEQLRIRFLITKKHTPYIQDLLETGVNLGLSIGGYVTSYDEKNRIINAIQLHEISLTAMPANWDTFGTVTSNKGLVESTCITGACHAIVKKLESENMDEKPIEEPTTKADEVPAEEVVGLTEEKVIELINEYMAEKEATIAQEITDKIESQLNALVEAKVQELLQSDEQEEVPAEDETKAEEEPSTEEETDEDEEKEDETKSFDPSMISEEISKGIAAAFGDEFVDQVASKMFGELDKQRKPSGKFDEYQKSLETETNEPVDEVVEKSTYTTAETAKILMQKQASANPLQAAIMKNLK